MKYEFSELTGKIINCFIKVHQVLGPGFLEKIYHRALLIEFRRSGLKAESEQEIQIFYEGEEVGRHRLDIIVEDKVVVELKTADRLSAAHYSQLRSYLKASDLNVGLLVNFSGEKADFRRVDIKK